jgi:hypothetical protein
MRYNAPKLLLVGSAQSLVLNSKLASDVTCEPHVCVIDNFTPESRCEVGL